MDPIEYLLRFGDFDFPSGFLAMDMGGGFDLSGQARAQSAGSNTSNGRTLDRQLIINGEWAAETVEAWQAKRDEILRAVGSGPQNLWFGRNDRYYKDAQLESWGQSDPRAGGRLWGVMGQLSLTFVSARYPNEFTDDDPYSVEEVEGGGAATITLPLSYGPAATTKGDAETLPLWTVEIVTAGTGDIVLTAGAKSCLLTSTRDGGEWEAGDIITLNADGAVGTLNGVATPGIYDRKIPRIVPGIASAQITTAGTVRMSKLKADYPGRWI